MPGFFTDSWLHPPCSIKKQQGLLSAGGEPSHHLQHCRPAQRPTHTVASPPRAPSLLPAPATFKSPPLLALFSALLPAKPGQSQEGPAMSAVLFCQERRLNTRNMSWLERRNLRYRKRTTAWKPGKLYKLHVPICFLFHLFLFPKRYFYICQFTNPCPVFFTGRRRSKSNLHPPKETNNLPQLQ